MAFREPALHCSISNHQHNRGLNYIFTLCVIKTKTSVQQNEKENSAWMMTTQQQPFSPPLCHLTFSSEYSLACLLALPVPNTQTWANYFSCFSSQHMTWHACSYKKLCNWLRMSSLKACQWLLVCSLLCMVGTNKLPTMHNLLSLYIYNYYDEQASRAQDTLKKNLQKQSALGLW